MVIQEWEGYISEINGDVITYELYDVTDPHDDVEEVAEFTKDKFHLIKPEDLTVGLYIKWCITDKLKSVIDYYFEEHERYFTQAQLDEANRKAKIMFKKLQGVDPMSDPTHE